MPEMKPLGMDHAKIAVMILDEIEQTKTGMKEIFVKIERECYEMALKETLGNKAKAARLLGVGRTTLIERVKSLEIGREFSTEVDKAPDAPRFYYDKCLSLLRPFFDNDEMKVSDWMRMKNLNFGGAAPIELIRDNRGHKVLFFIESALGESAKAKEQSYS